MKRANTTIINKRSHVVVLTGVILVAAAILMVVAYAMNGFSEGMSPPPLTSDIWKSITDNKETIKNCSTLTISELSTFCNNPKLAKTPSDLNLCKDYNNYNPSICVPGSSDPICIPNMKVDTMTGIPCL